MSTELHKAITRELFARFTASDIPGVLATMTDDATWWIAGKPELNPSAGLYEKDRITRLFHHMLKQLRHGLKMTPLSMVAEGDRVAVEVVSEGDLHNGRQYRQEYHMLLQFQQGRICAVREYLDTQHAHAVWLAADPT